MVSCFDFSSFLFSDKLGKQCSVTAFLWTPFHFPFKRFRIIPEFLCVTIILPFITLISCVSYSAVEHSPCITSVSTIFLLAWTVYAISSFGAEKVFALLFDHISSDSSMHVSRVCLCMFSSCMQQRFKFRLPTCT